MGDDHVIYDYEASSMFVPISLHVALVIVLYNDISFTEYGVQ